MSDKGNFDIRRVINGFEIRVVAPSTDDMFSGSCMYDSKSFVATTEEEVSKLLEEWFKSDKIKKEGE